MKLVSDFYNKEGGVSWVAASFLSDSSSYQSLARYEDHPLVLHFWGRSLIYKEESRVKITEWRVKWSEDVTNQEGGRRTNFR